MKESLKSVKFQLESLLNYLSNKGIPQWDS